MGKKNKFMYEDLTPEEIMERMINGVDVSHDPDNMISNVIDHISQVYGLDEKRDYDDDNSEELEETPYQDYDDSKDMETSLRQEVKPIEMIKVNNMNAIKIHNFKESLIVPFNRIELHHEGDYDLQELAREMALSAICRFFEPRYILKTDEVKNKLSKYATHPNVVFSVITDKYVAAHVLKEDKMEIFSVLDGHFDKSLTWLGFLYNLIAIGANTHKYFIDNNTIIDDIDIFINEMDYNINEDTEYNHLGLLEMYKYTDVTDKITDEFNRSKENFIMTDIDEDDFGDDDEYEDLDEEEYEDDDDLDEEEYNDDEDLDEEEYNDDDDLEDEFGDDDEYEEVDPSKIIIPKYNIKE